MSEIYSQEHFKGIKTGLDLLDQDKKYASYCTNCNLSIDGELSNDNIGFDKYNTTGYGYSITSIWQLDNFDGTKTVVVLRNGQLTKGTP